MPPRRPASRLLAGAALAALMSGAVLLSIPVLFGTPQPKVFVYWRPIGDVDRQALERQFGLTEPVRRHDDVWSYVPLEKSPEALRAIVTHPAVADTDGINRRLFRIADTPPLTPRRGGIFEGTPAWIAGGARRLAQGLAGAAVVLACSAALVWLRGVAPTIDAPSLAVSRWLKLGMRVVGTPAFVAIAALAATLAWRFLTFAGFSNDHYAHLALAQQMLLGDRPIRDFSDPGWPLMYWLSAVGWRLGGDALGIEWAISAGGFALGAACTVIAGYRLSRSLPIALTVTALEVLAFPRTYSYPKVLVYAFGAWALIALATRPTRRRTVMMAAVVAIAFLFRHDHGLFIGIAAAGGVWLASRSDGPRIAAARVAMLTAATAAFLLPWVLFLAMNGGVTAYFQQGLEYSRAEADATRLESWPTFVFTPVFDATASAEAWLVWLFWILPVVCGAIVIRRALRGQQRWQGELASVAALTVLAILVNATFLREDLQVRLPDAIVPPALLGAWLLGACWIGRWRRHALQTVVRLATVAILIVSVVAIGRVSDAAGQYANTDINRGFKGVRDRSIEVARLLGSSHRQMLAPPSRFATALMPFFGYLDRCSVQTDRLVVTGEGPEIPVLAGRRFAGDGVVFGSWYSSAAHQDRSLERLRADPALFAIEMGDYDAFHTRYGLIDAYLTQEYEPLTDIPVENGGTIQILVLRSRPAAGTDAETGWRCFTRRS